MSAVTSKFYKNQGDKSSIKTAGDSSTSSVQNEGGSIASGKTHVSYSTTSSSVSQHSEDRDEEPDEMEEGEWGEMEVRLNLKRIKESFPNLPLAFRTHPLWATQPRRDRVSDPHQETVVLYRHLWPRRPMDGTMTVMIGRISMMTNQSQRHQRLGNPLSQLPVAVIYQCRAYPNRCRAYQ